MNRDEGLKPFVIKEDNDGFINKVETSTGLFLSIKVGKSP